MTEPAEMTPLNRAGAVRPGSRLARLAVHPAFISLLLAAATMAVFYPVTGHDFVRYDDPEYVTANPQVQGGVTRDGLMWAFRTRHAGNWHPLTWFSHMLDCQLYGLKPAGHHLTNLLVHALNTVLLFVLLRRLTGALWRSAFVAALFALHPLHVESVAWISERKDVLCAFFFMLTLWTYARFAECRMQNAECRSQEPVSRTTDHGPRTTQHATRNTDHASRFTFHVSRFTFLASRYYVLSLLCFTLGLMSKPMLVTLPFVLLLLDYWPLQRFQLSTLDSQPSTNTPRRRLQLHTQHSKLRTLLPLALEKWPFFLLSVISCAITILAQKNAMQPLANLSLSARLSNACVAYARYLGMTLWPVNLAAPYLYPAQWPLAEVLFAVALLAGMTIAALWLRRRFPFAATGWFWFLGMLVPVIGLVQVGEQSLADRYAYLPSIGLFLLLTWGAGAAFTRWRVPKVVCGIAAGSVLLSCAGRTRDQLACWQNTETLFHHAIAVTKDNWLAWFNLGWHLDDQGRLDEALAAYHKAVELQPNYADALINIGAILASRRQFSEAVPYFERALRANPDLVDCHDNLGHALLETSQFAAAIPHLRLVVQQKPNDVEALNALAEALARTGQFAQVIPHLEASLRANPDQPGAHYYLANALTNLSRINEAITHYRLTLEEKPDYAAAHNALGLALTRKGDLAEAVQHFREAIRYEPANPDALNNLAWIRATHADPSFRNGAEAVQLARRACELTRYQRPIMVGTLAAAYAEAGRFEEAVATAQKARDLALAAGQKEVAEKNQQLLELYRARQPYHEPAQSPLAPTP